MIEAFRRTRSMFFAISFALVIGLALVVVLCYVWMMSTRESQRRQEAAAQRIVTLLEEQNELLRQRQP